MKRVALITGGSRGIGLGISRCLAKEGFDLIICGVRVESSVAAVLEELESSNTEVAYVQADVSDAEARLRLIETVRERFGCLHVLVNNAGVAPQTRTDILEATEESFQHVLQTNLQGPYFLTQSCAKWMITQKEHDPTYDVCIINISSISASVASVSRGEYCISKAGVSMATKLWAARLGVYHIPVYEIRPGVIKTDMTAGVEAKYDKLFAEGLAVEGRWGTPEDVGRAAASLVRGDLPYSTGQVIMVDGGMTILRL